MRTRGLVLAAGRAERLRPLSDSHPKPLLPFKGVSVLARTLGRFREAGCEAVALNLHHLGSRIREEVGAARVGMPVVYSEESSILGTLGALGRLREFLSGADLVLVANGDTLCEWPLERLIERHLEHGSVCTMIFSSRARPEDYGGGVLVQDERRVQSFARANGRGREEGERLVFGGCYALDPSLLRRIPDGYSNLVPHLLIPLLEEQAQISALLYDGPWHDLGTPQRYLDACVGEGAPWTHASAEILSGSVVRRSVVEREARVEGAEVVESVLLPGSRIGSGSVLTRCLVGPDARVPPRTSVANQLLTRSDASRGGLESTPLA